MPGVTLCTVNSHDNESNTIQSQSVCPNFWLVVSPTWRQAEKFTWPPAARCASINASLPGGRTPPTPASLPIPCLLFLPRLDGVGMTTAGGTTTASFLSDNRKQREETRQRGGGGRVAQRCAKHSCNIVKEGRASRRRSLGFAPRPGERAKHENYDMRQMWACLHDALRDRGAEGGRSHWCHLWDPIHMR